MSKHDRTKSGGIMDTLFGRPKNRGRGGNGTNGGRPISSDQQFYADTQDLNTEVLKLSVSEVDKQFLEILEDMNIPKDKREPLLKKNLDEKRDMLLMHLKGMSC